MTTYGQSVEQLVHLGDGGEIFNWKRWEDLFEDDF